MARDGKKEKQRCRHSETKDPGGVYGSRSGARPFLSLRFPGIKLPGAVSRWCQCVRLRLAVSYISQSYLRYAVCVGKHGLESVVHADVVQNAHAELSLGLVSCNINRRRREVNGWMTGCAVTLRGMPTTTSRWVVCFSKVLMSWMAFLTAIPVGGQMAFRCISQLQFLSLWRLTRGEDY